MKNNHRKVAVITGAGGGIGMGAAAIAPADGYTLLAAHPALLALPESERLFGRKTTYDRSSFAPLALLVAESEPAQSPRRIGEPFVWLTVSCYSL